MNTRSTTRAATKLGKGKDTKDEDDRSIPKLDPPRTQLELAKGHHVAFGIIDLAAKNPKLKGLVSTDLPGQFPLTSSKGNNYIFCMYNYDSNIIWFLL